MATPKLARVIAAFIGKDSDAALTIVQEAVHFAVVQYAQHGNKDQMNEASAFIEKLKTSTVKPRAIVIAWREVKPSIAEVKPGKVKAADALALADDIAERFFVMGASVLNVETPAKPARTPIEKALACLKALCAINDDDVLAALASPDAPATALAMLTSVVSLANRRAEEEADIAAEEALDAEAVARTAMVAQAKAEQAAASEQAQEAVETARSAFFEPA